jgi:hypothetical protein
MREEGEEEMVAMGDLHVEAIVKQEIGALEVAMDDGRVMGVQVHQPSTGSVQHSSDCPPGPVEGIRAPRLSLSLR